MGFSFTPSLEDEKIESLKTQYEFLKILRLRHQHWMSAALDADIQHVHLEIADLLEKITDHYSHLLDVLQKQRDIQ